MMSSSYLENEALNSSDPMNEALNSSDLMSELDDCLDWFMDKSDNDIIRNINFEHTKV